jgi:ribose 5-phosphate isomerase B
MTDGLVVGFGSDDAGYALKRDLAAVFAGDPSIAHLRDFGVGGPGDDDPYPNIGLKVSQAVADGELDRAVLICGTGIGMAITANKVPGVRAAVAYDGYSVERSVLSNDCQILALGARVISFNLAERIVREWLGYRFDPQSRSAEKIAVLTDYEQLRDTRRSA